MAFTYADTPESVPRDAVRLLIGDTDSGDALLSDAEIAFYLAENGNNEYRAASEACKAIAAKLSRLPDIKTGRVQISNKDRARDFLALSKQLYNKFLAGTVLPYAGGISEADKQTQEENEDRVPPFFARNSFIQPGSENPLTPTRTE